MIATCPAYVLGAPEFCGIYTAGRDVPASWATRAADRYDRLGPPTWLTTEQAAGFDVYLDHLRDAGDGRDEGLYEDQYRQLLARPARTQLLAFLERADEQCGTGSPGDAPTDATKDDYCKALGEPLGDGPGALFPDSPEDVEPLAVVGTPPGLGSRGASDDLSAEARRGFEVYVDRFGDLTDAQRTALREGADDAYRQAFGVTDAFYLDTWFLSSFALCRPGYE